MAKARIGINGFGRSGRGLAATPDGFDVVQVNDLTNEMGYSQHLLDLARFIAEKL